MKKHDDGCYGYCARCGSDLTEDEIVTVELARGIEVEVCESCLRELASQFRPYPRDGWDEYGITIKDFI